MEFENVIRERKAVRKFSDKIIEQEKLDKILEAGRIAPTAKNTQPIKMNKKDFGFVCLTTVQKVLNYKYKRENELLGNNNT